MSRVHLTGGCLCQNIRYELFALPFCAEYCHCRMCQKSVGAVAVNWMDINSNQIRWLGIKPKEYHSSEFVRRGFCTECGASMTFRDKRHPEYMTISVATLDDPDIIKPDQHIYTESIVNWLNIEDDCVRFSGAAIKNTDD